MDITSIPPDKLNEFAKAMGQRGGQTTLDKYGKEHFKNIRKLSRGRKTKDETRK
jgi:hypothetical protein